MLADLHSGNAAISILPYDATNGTIFVAGNGQTAVDFKAADQLFTLKDSLQLTSDDPSSTDVKIDQLDQVIDSIFEDGGNWRVTGNVPTNATAVFDYFFNAGQSIATAINGQTLDDGKHQTYTGKSYLNTKKSVEVAMLLESESRNTAIAFAHVKLQVNYPAKDDDTNPSYLTFTGAILPNKATAQGDFAILAGQGLATTTT
jgi:hypothetical protein